jgi:hypothetical protein
MKCIVHAAVILTLSASCLLAPALAVAAPPDFAFGIINHAVKNSDESMLRRAITETDADNLAFVVVNGIKSPTEDCSDALYGQRRDLLNQAQNGLIMSLAASDWALCKDEAQQSDAIERLSRVREMFYGGELSFGASKLPLLRQSLTAKFRSYTENSRWEFGNTLFATVNLPANNNHFLQSGGRNSEFEDRLIANRNWLQHLFAYAALKKSGAIVFFTDGNPFGPPPKRSFLRTQRDGFSETRRLFSELSEKFRGRVLIVHGEMSKTSAEKQPNRIAWTGNLGQVGVGDKWLKIDVHEASAQIFSVAASDQSKP